MFSAVGFSMTFDLVQKLVIEDIRHAGETFFQIEEVDHEAPYAGLPDYPTGLRHARSARASDHACEWPVCSGSPCAASNRKACDILYRIPRYLWV